MFLLFNWRFLLGVGVGVWLSGVMAEAQTKITGTGLTSRQQMSQLQKLQSGQQVY